LLFLRLSLLSEAREELEFCIGIAGKWCDIMCPSVTSISSHSFKARGLKFGRNNPHIHGSKSVDLNFEILSRS